MSSEAPKQSRLSSIPVKVIGAPAQPQQPRYFHWKRRAVQIFTVVLLVMIPALGLFRIDPMAGAFVVLDRQIWFSDFFIMFGFWISVVCLLILLYSTAGTVFCGWACPQNTLSEWANDLTRKLLGKRAGISMTGEHMQVAAAKNKLLNWLVLGTIFLVVSLAFALVPLFYFYPPKLVWAFVTFQEDTDLARSLHWIYLIFVLMILLDVAVLRHFWCRFVCIYRIWQHSFKTKETLHIGYDSARADECAKCNYCVTSCFLNLDPRKTEIYDSCINCGECIDACNRLHAKEGKPGLLTFEFGEPESKRLVQFRNAAYTLLGRTRWVVPFGLFGLAMFAYGMWNYEPYHVAVYRAEAQKGDQVREYRIAISNKLYRPGEVEVRVDRLSPDQYSLSSSKVRLDPLGRGDVILSMGANLPHGLLSIPIEVSSPEGWSGHFSVQHLSE